MAAEVRERLVDEGHDTAEFAIVASGPNSASPHHEPAERVIRAGEPLLLDIGGRRGGLLLGHHAHVWVAGDDGRRARRRTSWRSTASSEQAQAAGRAAVRRAWLRSDSTRRRATSSSAGGHGEHFFHRLGHGIGLEVHEDPTSSGQHRAAAVGDTFSIEPGIYLEGRYGVRIEDIVVCTRGRRRVAQPRRAALRGHPGR